MWGSEAGKRGELISGGKGAYLVYLYEDEDFVFGEVDRVRAPHGVCDLFDHEISRQDSVVADSRANGELHRK